MTTERPRAPTRVRASSGVAVTTPPPAPWWAPLLPEGHRAGVGVEVGHLRVGHGLEAETDLVPPHVAIQFLASWSTEGRTTSVMAWAPSVWRP